MKVAGAVVAVTGAGAGIGRALCNAVAASGAAAVAVIDIDGDRARETAAALACRSFPVTLDLCDDVAVEAVFAELRGELGPIDLLCSNVGVGGPSGGVELHGAQWDMVWRANVMTHVNAVRAVLPTMLERSRGHLLLTASAAGLLTSLGAAPYAVTKHAVVALAEWLAITHGDAGVGVSCLCPQAVDTELLARSLSTPGSSSMTREGVLAAEVVAAVAIEGLAQDRFLILPHPEVAAFGLRRATDHDRWIRGMRRCARSSD